MLYLISRATYLTRMRAEVDASPLTDLTPAQSARLRDDIIAAEQTGLHPTTFDPAFVDYLQITRDSSNWGFRAAFFATTVLAVVGLITGWRLVRRPTLCGSARPRHVASKGEDGRDRPATVE